MYHVIEGRDTSDSIHFALVNADTAITEERLLGIVECTRSVTISVVGYLVVIPLGNPGEVLVGKQQVKIGSVLAKTSAVIVESEDGPWRVRRTCVSAEYTGAGLAMGLVNTSSGSRVSA